MYAIMGATGQTGGAALRELVGRGAGVRAITRDPARARGLLGPGVEIVAADPTDAAALARAFTGTRGVYVLNVPGADAVDPIASGARVSAAIAAALAEARPARVAALSAEGAHLAAGTGVIRVLHDFEHALTQVGLPLTRLRASYFMENWASGLAPAAAEGLLPSLLQPLDRPRALVSVVDIGAVVAELLLAADAPEVVNLVGPRDYAPADAAAVLAAELGRPVAAVAPPREAWEPALTAAGLGAGYAAALAAMYDGVNAGTVRFEPGVGVGRRGVVTLATALARVVAKGGQPVPA